MDIFKFLGSLFGGKKKEEEEKARQAAVAQAPKAPSPSPTPVQQPQQPLRKMTLPSTVAQSPLPQPIQRAMEPVVKAAPSSTGSMSSSGKSGASRKTGVGSRLNRFIDSGKFEIDIPNTQDKFNPLRPASWGKGVIDIAGDAASSFANFLGNTALDKIKEDAKSNLRKSGIDVPKTDYDQYRSDLYKTGASLRRAVGEDNDAPTRDLSKPLLDDPEIAQVLRTAAGPILELSNLWGGGTAVNAVKGGARRQLARNVVREAPIGTVSGGAAGAQSSEGQTLREMGRDIATNAALGTGVAAGASGLLTGLTSILNRTGLSRLANRAEQPPEVAALRRIAEEGQTPAAISRILEQTGTSIEDLNNAVQRSLLDRQNAGLPSQYREAGSDIPAYQRSPISDTLDDIPTVPNSERPVVDTPSIVGEIAREVEPEVVGNPRPITPPGGENTYSSIDLPTYLRNESSAQSLQSSLRKIVNDPEAPESVRIEAKRQLDLSEQTAQNARLSAEARRAQRAAAREAKAAEEAAAQQAATPAEPVIQTSNPVEEAAIPNAANEIPENQAPIAPQNTIDPTEAPAPTSPDGGLSEAPGGDALTDRTLPNGSPIAQLLEAIQRASRAQEELQPIRAKEKASRSGMGESAYEEAGGGEAGFRAKLREYAGEYEKAGFSPLEMSKESQDSFINLIEADPTLREFEKLNTQNAFRKLWGANPDAPTNSDVRYMRNFLNKYIDDTTEAVSPEVAAGSVGAPDLGDPVKTTTNAKELVDAVMGGIEEATVRYGDDWYAKLGDVLSLPRTTMTTLDFSFGARQGGSVAVRYFPEWKDANVSSAVYAFSPKSMTAAMKEIQDSSNYNFVNDLMKVRMPAVQGVNDEAMQAAKILGKIPLYGKLTDGSARAYDGGLTKLRWNLAQKMIENLGGTEKMLEDYTPQQIRKIGGTINNLTGYGDFGDGKIGTWANRLTDNLGGALFAPKLWASRLQMLNPAFYLNPRTPGPAKRMAIESMGSFLGAAVVVLTGAVAAANAMGRDDVSVSTDPLNSDFLKLKIGNTRFDLLMGLQQNVVLLARIQQQAKVSSTTGERVELGGGYGDPNSFDLFVDTIVNKLNPLLAFGVNAARSGAGEDDGNPLTRKNRFGEDMNLGIDAAKMAVPLSMSSIYDLYQDTGDMMKTAAMAAPGFFGVGVQTYGDMPTKDTAARQAAKDQKALSDDLNARGIPNPYDYQGENSFEQEVQRYRESDNFTIVAEALENKLEAEKKKGATQIALDKIQKEIDVARVAEEKAIKYADLAMYHGAISGVDAANTITDSEFKRMLDDEDELYDPDLAARLYQIDTWMAEAGVSSNSTNRSKNYYQLPKAGSGRSGRGADIASPVNLRGLNLSSLRPTSLASQKIPTIKPLSGRSLTVKPRRITVS